MEREKPTFDILGRIERERLSRGWSEYALAENSRSDTIYHFYLAQTESSTQCSFS